MMIDSKKVKEIVANYLPDFINELEKLTNIDSGNGDAEGTDAVAKIVGARLEALGASVEYRKNPRATHTIVRFTGKGSLRLLLIAHVDTVFEKGEAQKRPFRVDENMFAYGPGVGDDKATVVQTIYSMQTLKDLNYDNFKEIILYYNGEEEGGSSTAEEIVAELAQQVDMCIIMDTARPNWGIVTQRKGSANYEIQVEGIAGHHGNASQISANAIMELGNQISLLYKMASPLSDDPSSLTMEKLKEKGIQDHGQFIPDNTINVGVIGSSNQKINSIPKDAFAKINVRCFSVAEQQRLDREIKDLPHKTVVPGTKVTVTGGIKTGPMEKTPQAQILVDMFKKIVKREYNADVVEWIAGGLTDGNRAAKYVPTIDALGVENYDEHTDHESVDLKTAVPRTVALVCFILELTGKWPEIN
ncbi:M20/M25/M40 family metallo-hydrolase [Pelosinus sp. UFO1]|uniref:M20/M25/M40 family metallo-hydrolase n=1 Tax=Pelosinus sp. UFO1 TaxID=484770 RepID=UPI000A01BE83|nr:M20/M25/M40 family metallo-hydrolase [Pelosinus sp. UFO1]